MSTKADLWAALREHWIPVVLFSTPLGIYVIGSLFFHLPELIQHILLTLSAVLGIHLLDRLVLAQETKHELMSLVQDVRKDLKEQTQSLLHSSTSLEALARSGIARVYPSRSDATSDIRADLESPANSSIRLLGVSLNDFLQEMDSNLHQAWNAIQSYVRGERPINDRQVGLDIRVLILDPRCFGAKLRSESESVTATALANRLVSDVESAAKYMQKLVRDAEVNYATTKVTLLCRLYRVPPILFMALTDSVCYVQQYHFWSERSNRAMIPVFKYRNLPQQTESYPYHPQMKHHFDWLWHHASIGVDEFLDEAAVGADIGIHQCGVENIYTDPGVAESRLVFLLKRARTAVSIQGVSLNSYFKPGLLRNALTALLTDGEAQVEVLLLDPDCEQAQYRSYRERLFVAPDASYDEYVRHKEYTNSDLDHDTRRTIAYIRDMVNDIKSGKEATWRPKLVVKTYATAPACFVIRIDDRVLVEQYQYGKITPQAKTHAILGKDMPLFEYRETPVELYEKTSDAIRRPFRLLVNHLDWPCPEYCVSRGNMIPPHFPIPRSLTHGCSHFREG